MSWPYNAASNSKSHSSFSKASKASQARSGLLAAARTLTPAAKTGSEQRPRRLAHAKMCSARSAFCESTQAPSIPTTEPSEGTFGGLSPPSSSPACPCSPPATSSSKQSVALVWSPAQLACTRTRASRAPAGRGVPRPAAPRSSRSERRARATSGRLGRRAAHSRSTTMASTGTTPPATVAGSAFSAAPSNSSKTSHTRGRQVHDAPSPSSSSLASLVAVEREEIDGAGAGAATAARAAAEAASRRAVADCAEGSTARACSR
mmetsp:Transcript_25208/g.84128  ORF Transcript_25208/g.84128 Transcript_25208/m.84128 type:complete len:262 (+) Transcript_25208:2091-2876(+)